MVSVLHEMTPASDVQNRTARGGNELFEGYSEELLTIASAACIIFIIVGVPGNLLTIVALSRGKQTRNATAVFIINLSLSDLLFGCFNLPLAASTFLRRSWIHGDLLCRLFPLLRYGLLAVSLITVSLITINRYILIAHPRQYPRIYRHGYLALMVASTWLTSFSFMIPTWNGLWGTFGLDTSIGSCSILHDKYGRSPKEFLFVAAFMVPCICIVICYARIFCTVRRAAYRTREKTPQIPAAPRNGLNVANVCPNNPHKHLTVERMDLPVAQPFVVDADIEYIDMSDSNEPADEDENRDRDNSSHLLEKHAVQEKSAPKEETVKVPSKDRSSHRNPIQTSLKTSFNKITSRKNHYVSIGNTSNASSIYPGRMSQKDRRLLKMILVIFVTFVICYLPITITKIWKSATEVHIVNISGYLLIYLTTCINPLIYVLMSLEYRQAYRNLLLCRKDQKKEDFHRAN